jgi:hypothetical protein
VHRPELQNAAVNRGTRVQATRGNVGSCAAELPGSLSEWLHRQAEFVQSTFSIKPQTRCRRTAGGKNGAPVLNEDAVPAEHLPPLPKLPEIMKISTSQRGYINDHATTLQPASAFA